MQRVYLDDVGGRIQIAMNAIRSAGRIQATLVPGVLAAHWKAARITDGRRQILAAKADVVARGAQSRPRRAFRHFTPTTPLKISVADYE